MKKSLMVTTFRCERVKGCTPLHACKVELWTKMKRLQRNGSSFARIDIEASQPVG